jgi:hypothetical protein
MSQSAACYRVGGEEGVFGRTSQRFQSAELRSAWTAEGGGPYVGNATVKIPLTLPDFHGSPFLQATKHQEYGVHTTLQDIILLFVGGLSPGK